MLRKVGSNFKIAKKGTVAEDVIRDGREENSHVIEAKNPDFLYFRSRAISSGDYGPLNVDGTRDPNPNGNGDFFSRKELEASYKTFENRNLFLNHESDHPIKSIGKVISAEPVEDPDTGEFYIETLAKIDRKLHPELARKIETGELNMVSMGCSCEESQCSVCGTKIYSDEDKPCHHLSPQGLGKIYAAETNNEEFGIKKGQPTEAFSINKGLNFNELSIVHVPADDSAMIKTVLANAQKYLTKKSTFTDKQDIVSQLKKILNQLECADDRKVVEEQICACEVSKEDSKMSEKKATSKRDDFNKKSYELSEDDHVNMILDQKLSALDYQRLLNSIEKKQQTKDTKKEEKIKTEAKKESEIDKSFVKKVADAVKDFLSPNKEEHKVKASVSDDKVDVKKESDLIVTAKYDSNDRTWSIYDDGVRLISARLDDLWDKDQLRDEEFVKKVTSDEYANALVSRYKAEGPDKVAQLLGLEYKSLDKEADVEKEYEKSKKAIDKNDETSVGEHLKKHEEPVKESSKNKKAYEHCPNCNKHLDDCVCDPSQAKDDSKKHSVKPEKESSKKEADLPVEEKPRVEEEKKPEETPDGRPDEEEAPEVKLPEEKEESAFDKLEDPIIIGDGYTAEKDKETGEIVLKKNGEEHKRLPDAFGDDVPSIMKFFQVDLGVQHEEPATNKVEEPAVQHVEHEEKPEVTPEETPEEEHLEETSAYAAKKAEIEKKAAELKKKEEEIQKKEAEFKQKAEKEKAQLFASSIRSRQEKAKSVVQALVNKDLLKLDQNTIDARLKEGDTVLDARHYALKEAIDKQIRDLLEMDEISLQAFEKTISNVEIKKQANRLTSPLSIGYSEQTSADKDIEDIFNSMGNGGGNSVFRS